MTLGASRLGQIVGEAFPTYLGATSGPSNAVTYPSVPDGSILILIVATNGINTSAGEGERINQEGGGGYGNAIFRIRKSGPAGTTIFQSGGGTIYGWVCLAFSNGKLETLALASNGLQSGAASIDPPNLAPAEGYRSRAWIAALLGNQGVTAAPTNYGNLTNYAGSFRVAAATRELSAASENPPAFAGSTSAGYCFTLGLEYEARLAAGGVTTWNPADKSAQAVLSDANRTRGWTGTGDYGGVRGTTSRSSGKWYLEYKIVSPNSERPYTGFAKAAQSLTGSAMSASSAVFLFNGASVFLYKGDGVATETVDVDDGEGGTYPVTQNVEFGPIAVYPKWVGVAIDLDASPRTITFRLGAQSKTWPLAAGMTGALFPFTSGDRSSLTTINAGQDPWLAGGPPSGYQAWG